MFKQYFKQAIQMLKENRLTSVISILGTALSIAMILVVILQFQIKLVGFRPESNRGRMLYIMGIRADSRNSGDRNSTAMSDGVVKECLYPLQTPEAVTAIASNRAIVSLPNRQLFEEYVIKYTDPGFWKVFDFRFISGKPFTEADFSSGLPCAVITNTLARKLFGSEDSIGKEVLMGYVPYTITGVVEAPTRAANSAYADVWAPYTSNTNYVNSMSCGGVCGSFQGVILARSASDFDAIRTEIKQAVSRYNATGREFVLGMNFVFSRLDVALGSNDVNGGILKGWKEYLTQTAPLLLFLLLNLLSAGLPAIRISREQIVDALNNK